MNLNSNPTPQQLRQLLAQCEDTAGNHVVWVKKSGEVDVTRISSDLSPSKFRQNHPDMQMRCETFMAGNEYVGPDAAANDEWVSELLDRLVSEWQTAKGKPDVAYIPVSGALKEM